MTAALRGVPTYLFDLDPTETPPGARRCGRPTKAGRECLAWPSRYAPACAHHITAAELAKVERQRGAPAVA